MKKKAAASPKAASAKRPATASKGKEKHQRVRVIDCENACARGESGAARARTTAVRVCATWASVMRFPYLSIPSTHKTTYDPQNNNNPHQQQQPTSTTHNNKQTTTNAKVRVWWPPTDNKKRTGFSGAFWPAAVTGRTRTHFSVRYDNGDEEDVHCDHIFPSDVPVEFGEEVDELRAGEFVEVSNRSKTDPCAWLGRVKKVVGPSACVVTYPFHDAPDERVQAVAVRRARVWDGSEWRLAAPYQSWEDGEVTSPLELELVGEGEYRPLYAKLGDGDGGSASGGKKKKAAAAGSTSSAPAAAASPAKKKQAKTKTKASAPPAKKTTATKKKAAGAAKKTTKAKAKAAPAKSKAASTRPRRGGK